MDYELKKVSIEAKQLPSGFGFYPKGTQVRFVPMTTKEISILNESDLNSELIFKHALSNIQTRVIEPRDLTFSDFVFISLQRRLYSQTEILCTLDTVCPECGKKIVDEFDFNDIEFEEPKDNRLQRCQLSGYTVEVGPLTIGNMLDMLESENGVNTIDTLAHSIKKIYIPDSEATTVPEKDLFPLAQKIIENTWGQEREILNYIDTLQTHGMKPREIKCSNCNYTWKEDLGTADALIFPRSGFRDSIRDKVQPC